MTEQEQKAFDQMREALKFYAERDHFMLGDPDAWDTVSGEPQNYWCDEAGTATIEDGSVARQALTAANAVSDHIADARKMVQPQAQGEANRLYDAIEDCLLNHRLHSFMGDDEDNYPLVDHLSHGVSIEDGRHEIRLICDSIYNTVLKPAHSQATEPTWMPIETAPTTGLLLLAVVDAAGELRTFCGEASFSDGRIEWQITTGWTGFTRLRSAWKVIGWQPLPAAPEEKH